MLKPGLGFQHIPRDLVNVNAWKTMFDPYIVYLVIKNIWGGNLLYELEVLASNPLDLWIFFFVPSQSCACLTQRDRGPGLDTRSSHILLFLLPLIQEGQLSVTDDFKYVHVVLVNCLGVLSLPRKSVVRFTDHPDMTIVVYRWHKIPAQQKIVRVAGGEDGVTQSCN